MPYLPGHKPTITIPRPKPGEKWMRMRDFAKTELVAFCTDYLGTDMLITRIFNESTSGMSIYDVRKVVDRIGELITEALVRGQSVTLEHFGTFRTVQKKPRNLRPRDVGGSGKTFELMVYAPRIVKFKPDYLTLRRQAQAAARLWEQQEKEKIPTRTRIAYRKWGGKRTKGVKQKPDLSK